MWSCWSREYVTRGELWGFKSPSQAPLPPHFLPRDHDHDVELSETSPAPCPFWVYSPQWNSVQITKLLNIFPRGKGWSPEVLSSGRLGMFSGPGYTGREPRMTVACHDLCMPPVYVHVSSDGCICEKLPMGCLCPSGVLNPLMELEWSPEDRLCSWRGCSFVPSLVLSPHLPFFRNPSCYIYLN